MASNLINSSPVVDLQQKDCSKEAPVNGNLRHSSSDMLYQDGTSLEKAEFRFSASRLPKWAQRQITDDSAPVDIDSNSSKVKQPNFTLQTSILFFSFIISLFCAWKGTICIKHLRKSYIHGQTYLLSNTISPCFWALYNSTSYDLCP